VVPICALIPSCASVPGCALAVAVDLLRIPDLLEEARPCDARRRGKVVRDDRDRCAVDKVEHESRIAERTIEIDAPVDKVEHESRIAERTIEIDGCW
jgi:hypothetical protein